MSAAPRRELAIALQSDKHPREYGPLARLVELLGFGTLSVYNDLWYQPPLLPLALAAQATERIRIGAAAYNPWTQHPVEIAGQVVQLDLLSGGRAYWGIARGAWLDEIGITQERPLTRMREAIDVVEQLLAGRQGEYAGQHFRLAAEHHLRYAVERPRVPLLVGGWGRRTLELAGARADEVKIGGSANPDVVPLVAEWLGGGALAAGRDATAIGICLGAVTVVDDDRETARALIRRQMALYLPVVAPLDPSVAIDPELTQRMAALVASGATEAAGRLVPDDLLDRFAFAGNPADIIAQCERLFAVGVTRIEFGTPHGVSSEQGLRLLGERVAPALAPWLAG